MKGYVPSISSAKSAGESLQKNSKEFPRADGGVNGDFESENRRGMNRRKRR
jgi:hypothetical protein